MTRGVLRNLRKTKRTRRRQAAWVVLDGGCAKLPCVLWDVSETGARIAAAHGSALPDVFGLFLSNDGKSRRFCQVVWRRAGQLGVRFVEDSVANIDLDPRPSWMRRKPASLPVAKNSAQSPAVQTSDLLLPGCGPWISSEEEDKKSSFRLSWIACGMLIMLVAATGLFGLAYFLDQADWAVAVCTGAESFCQHPEWSGVGAIAMFGVYLAVRGME